ncbi:hypothetical protein CFK38_03620 [Brachybacterium vulturis]|uniref:Uncharacterized protein n=1 Tax=Brachybacterium vulturis TaxID=2017484 RepID=A0A291GKJ4_9MICO|nr:hypothetical protein [Brachybacterium vulturis]ATG50708.1 hypothetical protein CFK38_03620 [Brachybacterium vulturis]
MRDATISTSRTRATSDHLIDYRPLPASYGDREALHSLRVAKVRAAERGEDPSTLKLPAPPEGPGRRPAGHPRRRALPSALLRVAGTDRRGRHRLSPAGSLASS